MNNISENVNYALIAGVKEEADVKSEVKLSEKEVKQKLKIIKDNYIKYSENVIELCKHYHKKELHDLLANIYCDLNIIDKLN